MTLPPQPQTLWAGLGTRILSSAVLAAVALGAVHLGGAYYLVMVGALALLLHYEWGEITGGGGLSPLTAAAAAAVVVALITAFAGHFAPALAVLSLASLALLAAGRVRRARWWTALAVSYIGVPCLALLWLRLQADAWLVYWLLATIWATDSGAYVVGRLVGGPRLAPRISPKKTWAGLLGGGAIAGLAGFVVAWAAAGSGPAAWAVASVVLGLWSQMGDLFESAVKRHFGVKDASRFIPGHGGFLDRVDGLLFAAPAVVLGVATGLL